MNLTINNFKMEQMLLQLKKLLPMRNKIGYVAARNTRILSDSLTEYFKFKNDLIEKYGEPDVNENGQELDTISIKKDSENFDIFIKEFDEIKDIEHEVELMTLSYEDVIGILTGEEILEFDWMLE